MRRQTTKNVITTTYGSKRPVEQALLEVNSFSESHIVSYVTGAKNRGNEVRK